MSSLYDFESGGARRKYEDAKGQLDAYLVKRLDLKADDQPLDCEKLGETERDTTIFFIVNHHFNISWYNEKVKKEKARFYLFFALSILILLAIPFSVGYLLLDGNTPLSTAEATVGGITLFLTVLLAFQRTMGAWLNQRNMLSTFWSAKSELSEALYTIEDKWRHKDLSKPDNRKTFFDELSAAIIKARAVVKDEQNKYFESMKAPMSDAVGLLDLAGIISSGRASADTIITGTGAKERWDKSIALAKKELELKTYREDMLFLQQQIATLSPENDQDRVTELKSEIDELRHKERAAREELRTLRLD